MIAMGLDAGTIASARAIEARDLADLTETSKLGAKGAALRAYLKPIVDAHEATWKAFENVDASLTAADATLVSAMARLREAAEAYDAGSLDPETALALRDNHEVARQAAMIAERAQKTAAAAAAAPLSKILKRRQDPNRASAENMVQTLVGASLRGEVRDVIASIVGRKPSAEERAWWPLMFARSKKTYAKARQQPRHEDHAFSEEEYEKAFEALLRHFPTATPAEQIASLEVVP